MTVMETKRLRRIGRRFVRTAAGAARYGKPIGAPILPGIDLPSKPRSTSGVVDLPSPPRKPARRAPKTLQRRTSDYEGWDKYTLGTRTYYTGPDPEAGDYIAVDANDTVIAEGATWGEVVQNLERALKIHKPVTPPSHLKPATKADLEKFAKVFGKRVPPGWHDIHITLDESKSVIAWGIGRQGQAVRMQSDHTEKANAAKKWARLKRLQKAMPKLDARLKDDYLTDDTAAAVMLMRKTSIRSGSRSKGQRGAVETYGATSLLGKHVTYNKESVTLTFTGKKGVAQKYLIKDPELIEMFRARRERAKGSPNDYLFDTSEAKSNEYIKKALGGDFSNKDLRTYVANAIAAGIVKGWTRNPPKTKTEFRKMRNAMADEVAKQLGNTRTMALGSYIDPSVWLGFAAEPSWLEAKWQ